MKCSACGKSGLRSTSRAIVVSQNEAPAVRLVCSSCLDRGLRIVPLVVAPVVNTSRADRREARDLLAPYIDRIRSRVAAITATKPKPFICGKLEAFEDVIRELEAAS